MLQKIVKAKRLNSRPCSGNDKIQLLPDILDINKEDSILGTFVRME